MPCSKCGAPVTQMSRGKGVKPVTEHLLGSSPDGCIRYLRRQVDELREELEVIRGAVENDD